MFCDEFHLVDLRVYDNCKKVMTGCEHVFNLAADMGGMGFIQSNHSVIMYNNTMISFNMLEAARVLNIKRYESEAPDLSWLSKSTMVNFLLCCHRLFYASSACIYPEGRQLQTEIEGGGLKEEHAWPAQVMLLPLVFRTPLLGASQAFNLYVGCCSLRMLMDWRS